MARTVEFVLQSGHLGPSDAQMRDIASAIRKLFKQCSYDPAPEILFFAAGAKPGRIEVRGNSLANNPDRCDQLYQLAISEVRRLMPNYLLSVGLSIGWRVVEEEKTPSPLPTQPPLGSGWEPDDGLIVPDQATG